MLGSIKSVRVCRWSLMEHQEMLESIKVPQKASGIVTEILESVMECQGALGSVRVSLWSLSEHQKMLGSVMVPQKALGIVKERQGSLDRVKEQWGKIGGARGCWGSVRKHQEVFQSARFCSIKIILHLFVLLHNSPSSNITKFK